MLGKSRALEELNSIASACTVYTAPMLGQEAALDVSRVQIGPPDEAVENNFNAACGLGRCAEYVDAFFGLS